MISPKGQVRRCVTACLGASPASEPRRDFPSRVYPTQADAIIATPPVTSTSDLPFEKIFLSFDGFTYLSLIAIPFPRKLRSGIISPSLTTIQPLHRLLREGLVLVSNLTDDIYYNTYLWRDGNRLGSIKSGTTSISGRLISIPPAKCECGTRVGTRSRNAYVRPR